MAEGDWRIELQERLGLAICIDGCGRVVEAPAAEFSGSARLPVLVVGSRFAACLGAGEGPRFEQALQRACAEGRAAVDVQLETQPDGPCWISCRLRRLEDGRVGVWIEELDASHGESVAHRVEAERLRSFVDNTADAFIAHDMNGRLVDVNKAMCDSVNYSREELLSMHIYDVELTVEKGSIRGIWSRMTHGIPVTIEGRHRRRDGSVFPVEVRLGLFGEGEGARVMALCRDISERKRAEAARHQLTEALAQARDEAVRADLAKSEFLANMSHELRTPLNAVIGYTELVTEDLATFNAEPLRPDLERIHGAASFLLGLINDILDISKIEAGRFDVFLEEVDLGELLAEVIGVIQPLAEKNKNTLSVVTESTLGLIRTDRVKLRQALTNLLSNAAKFTKEGRIELAISRQGVDDETLCFRVSDTGVGIPSERCEMIFEAFTQADSSTTRRFGGTGLGLAITRRFCQMLAGDVVVESVVGEGSTFTITIPVWACEVEVQAATQALGIDCGLRSAEGGAEAPVAVDVAKERSPGGLSLSYVDAPVVLVISRDPEVHDAIAKQLLSEGIRIRSAFDGREGIAHARAFRPVAILLDIHAPDGSGFSVLAALTAEPALAAIPVVFSSRIADEQNVLKLGVEHYLVKPVTREGLLAIFDRYREAGGQSVLVVDDDSDTREVYSRILMQSGWRVHMAEHGAAALAWLMSSDIHIDVIIVDLMMPVMDGFEVIRHLRADERRRTIPLVVASAVELSPSDRERLRGRVQSFEPTGPISITELTQRVVEIVRERTES